MLARRELTSAWPPAEGNGARLKSVELATEEAEPSRESPRAASPSAAGVLGRDALGGGMRARCAWPFHSTAEAPPDVAAAEDGGRAEANGLATPTV
jgi:hypothetical protein